MYIATPPPPLALNTFPGWLWRELQAIQVALGNSVAAAYGGLALSAPAAGFTISTAWQTITVFDTQALVARNIVADPAANTLTVVYSGAYQVCFDMSILHDSLNAGRTFGLRLFDATLNLPVTGDGFTSGVGRDVSATSISVAAIFDISAANVGHLLEVQIGNAPVNLVVSTVKVCRWTLNSVSEEA